MRTHYTTDTKSIDKNTPITVSGWINNIRDHGGVYFIDLRDSQGLLQLVANPTSLSETEYEKFHSLRDEWVIKVTGKIRGRGEGLANPNMETGDIELVIDELEVLSKAKTLPFAPGDSKVNEDLRMRYRYLDMRHHELQDALHSRSKIAFSARAAMDDMGYSEIETPLLIKSSEGGAEEVYATSKLFPGEFYSLPQSPQMYKQMLMVGGIEKYYSFAKCFRAESARSDRNIEFTQIDIERAFATREDIIEDVSNLFDATYKRAGKLETSAISETNKIAVTEDYLKSLGIQYSLSSRADLKIPQISYEDAIEHFGSDKPDLRCDMPLIDVKHLFAGSGFEVFSQFASDSKSRMKAVVAKGADNPDKLSKKKIKELEKFVMEFGAKGLAYFQCKEEDGKVLLKGPLSKMLSEEELDRIIVDCKLEVGDIIFFGAGEKDLVLDYMGRLRLKIAQELNLFKEGFYLLWVVDFPMFEKTSEGGIKSMHHPFTSPLAESWGAYKMGDIGVLEVLSDSYDLVLNGVELGGGSVRIHDQDLQREIFDIMGLSQEEVKEKFSFFIEALSFGTPPHAGFAFGYDRLVSLLLGKESIREVIAFPKTQGATCSMTQSPNAPDKEQMKSLGLRHRG